MPRNSAGVYALPPTNPVVPFTVNATSWANPTLSDIASELTNSLDRTGRGGMLAPFKIFDGTISAPGLSFQSEPSLGIYREATGVMGFVSGGAESFTVKIDRVSSPLRMDHKGFDTWKVAGQKSWKVYESASGALITVPSATADAEDWDLTKNVNIDPTGLVTINGTGLNATGTCVLGPTTINSLGVTNSVTIGTTLGVTGITTFSAGVKISTNALTNTFEWQQPSSTTYWSAGFNPTAGGLQYTVGVWDSTHTTFTAYFTIGKAAGNCTFSGGNITKYVQSIPVIATITSAYTCDFTGVGQSYVLTISGATTLTISNIPQGSIMRICFLATNIGLITWPGTVVWSTGSAPDLAAGTVKKAIVVLENDGVSLLATFVVY